MPKSSSQASLMRLFKRLVALSLKALALLLVRTALISIALYQWILSPLKDALFGPGCCRFYPSCSQYSRDSFKRHGFYKGVVLTLQRLAKCHPYHPGGIDEVPR